MSRHFVALAAGILAATLSNWPVFAGTLSVPNASFESPVTPFVSTQIDAWQKAPKPAWYDETGGFLWDQLAGLFKNTPAGSADHIENCDGAQAIWLFAVPEVALFQDYDSLDWNDPSPSHAFDARFEVGKSYRLTVGVIGRGGNMLEGVPLEIGLYYRDAAGNPAMVASTTVTNSTAVFPDRNHFVDFAVAVSTVQASDAWAGQHIGVRFLSTVSAAMQGGFWDLDNVRLTASSPPTLSGPKVADGQFQFTLKSDPGLVFDILTAGDPTLPVAGWARLTTVTNVTGDTLVIDTNTPVAGQFYTARQLP